MQKSMRSPKLRALLLTLMLGGLVSACSDHDSFNNSGTAAPVGSAGGSPTAAGAGTGIGGLGRGPSPVTLGAAGSYVILAQSAITDAGASPITGDVGLSPAAGSFIGLTCAQVTGAIHSVDASGPLGGCTVTNNAAALTPAIGAKDTAYTDATGRAPDYTETGAGNIGGLNLGPATYRWGTGVTIPTNVTLTGGANDVWIFQIAQGLSVSPGAQIILAGGAQPQNIFWATFAAADLDTSSQFKGILLSQTSVALRTGASLDGRIYAGTAVTLQGNAVSQP